jgi:CrcB protein
VATYDYRALAAVFAGGVVGTLARDVLTIVMPAPAATCWPWSTFTANIAGAFLIGYFTTRLLERLPVSSYRRPFLGTGVCGGFTTFSTMQVEILAMVQHHKYVLAVSYTVVSITLGFLAVYIATAAVRRARVTR